MEEGVGSLLLEDYGVGGSSRRRPVAFQDLEQDEVEDGDGSASHDGVRLAGTTAAVRTAHPARAAVVADMDEDDEDEERHRYMETLQGHRKWDWCFIQRLVASLIIIGACVFLVAWLAYTVAHN